MKRGGVEDTKKTVGDAWKQLVRQLKLVGCTQGFMLFCQRQIQIQKQLGQWSSECAKVLTATDDLGETYYYRSDAGKQFLQDMSSRWSAIKGGVEGAAVLSEAAANRAKRDLLQKQLRLCFNSCRTF